MTRKNTIASALAVVACALAVPAGATAATQIASEGSGAGEVSSPQGAATDYTNSVFYVADQGNNRVDTFSLSGAFQRAFGWSVASSAAELQECTVTCRVGASGSGKGQFNGPSDVAVDSDPLSSSYHDVYVVDSRNNRIEKFDFAGHFMLTFGGGVNKTTGANVCVEGSGDDCGAGAAGEGDGELFGRADDGSTATIAVGPGGVVYVVDRFQKGPERTEGFKLRLQEFNSSGAFVSSHILLETSRTVVEENAWKGWYVNATSLVVGPSGDLYLSLAREVGEGPGVYRYTTGGLQVGSVISPMGLAGHDFGALAIDDAGELFWGTFEALFDANHQLVSRGLVTEFGATGEIHRRFGYGELEAAPVGLVPVAGDSSIYAVAGRQILRLSPPPPGPIVAPAECAAPSSGLGNTSATLQAEVNPEGRTTHYHFEYVTDQQFHAGGFADARRVPSAPSEDPSAGDGFDLIDATVDASGLTPETNYHCRVVAANEDNEAGVVGEEGSFTTLPPLEIGSAWSTDVGPGSAMLHATVNPLGIPTTGFFQVVEEAAYLKDVEDLGPDHGFDHATRIPAAGQDLDFGAGTSPKAVAALATGLRAGTPYVYRVTAVDPFFPDGFVGPRRSLRTFLPPISGLPDSRRYELVSPPQKNSAELNLGNSQAGGVANSGLTLVQASAGNGDSVTYTSFTSFGDAKGAQAANQYLSRRTEGGWVTQNLAPFGFEKNALRPPFRGFSPDLRFAGIVLDEPACGPGALTEAVESLCLLDTSSGSSTLLTTEAPPEAFDKQAPFCTGYAGSSADGSRTIFSANGALAGAPAGEPTSYSLYEFSRAEGLRLVSVLPNGNAAKPAPETGFGAGSSGCSMGQRTVADAISDDGRLIFWTYGGSSPTKIYADVDRAETIQLDARAAGAPGPSGGGEFLAATPGGSYVFFRETEANQLVAGARPRALYRYDLATKQLESLTPPGSESAGVEGLLGASADGSFAYFVATGVLSGAEENARQESATVGQANLYRWHEGEGVRFLATLSSEDTGDWSPDPHAHTSRVSGDGLHVAFLSNATESLAGYDNVRAGGSSPRCGLRAEREFAGSPNCEEVFLYSASGPAEGLHCVSCNPSGQRPLGPSLLPGWSNPLEGPRYLAEDGTRLFFESFDALTPADVNGKRDVYEAELPGAGSCDTQSAAYSVASGFCIFLVSTGTSEDESYLLDASAEAEGRDVFFATRSRLVGWDQDDNYDVYDARVGGGFPEPAAPPICEGEGCRPPGRPAPAPESAATGTFVGPGNPKPPRARKKHRRHHRKHHRHGRRHKKRHGAKHATRQRTPKHKHRHGGTTQNIDHRRGAR